MSWIITHKPAYDVDFIELPKELQRRATQVHAELSEDPVTVRGNTIKPLKGWDNLWRYRLGDYRLIYSALPERRVVQLLAIGPRGQVYKRFDYSPDEESGESLYFSPEIVTALTPHRKAEPEWLHHPEWYQNKHEPSADTLLPRKLTPAQLNQWRIPGEYHATLMPCRTEEALLQAEVPTQILGRVMDALWPPTVNQLARQPDQVLFKPQDLEDYAAGTLRGFLLHLDEHQRRFVDWAISGPTLVKGGPGSGKSTVALYRVRALIEHALQTTGQLPTVLFTTFTNPLTYFSQSLLDQLLADLPGLTPDLLSQSVKVSTVDKLVMGIVRRHDATLQLANSEAQQEALSRARNFLTTGAAGGMESSVVRLALHEMRDSYLLAEFDSVIEGQNCQSLEAYLNANRAGRRVAFSMALRRAVWSLYEQYRATLAEQALATWGQLRQVALAQAQMGQERPWDYVIVDEAQDLTRVSLALCVELCRDPKGLFLTADANQSLYNRGFHWRNVHEQLQVTGRTRTLHRNYRSTRDIGIAAADVLRGADETDIEAMKQHFVYVGSSPALYAADGTAHQARWVAEQIWLAARDLRLPLNAAAVLVPSNSLGEPFAALLQRHGLPACYMPSGNIRLEERSVKVITLHASKGLEFPIVAIVHLEADRLPKELETTDEEELQEHLANQRRLLYVGCTRAMRYLFMTYDRSIPSPFVQGLSSDYWLRL